MRRLVFKQSCPVHPISESCGGGTLSVTYIHSQCSSSSSRTVISFSNKGNFFVAILGLPSYTIIQYVWFNLHDYIQFYRYSLDFEATYIFKYSCSQKNAFATHRSRLLMKMSGLWIRNCCFVEIAAPLAGSICDDNIFYSMKTCRNSGDKLSQRDCHRLLQGTK